MLYHGTTYSLIDNILKEGLVYDKKSFGYEYDTGAINQVLHKYKPNHLPEFVDRDKCIFFSPYLKYEENLIVKVDEKMLNPDKLFAFSYKHAHLIWCDVIDAPYSGEYSGYELSELAKLYWGSMTPFHDWKKLKHKNKKDFEILYFDKIPPEYLQIHNPPLSVLHKIKENLEGFDVEFITPYSIHIGTKNKNRTICSLKISKKDKSGKISFYRNDKKEELLRMIFRILPKYDLVVETT